MSHRFPTLQAAALAGFTALSLTLSGCSQSPEAKPTGSTGNPTATAAAAVTPASSPSETPKADATATDSPSPSASDSATPSPEASSTPEASGTPKETPTPAKSTGKLEPLPGVKAPKLTKVVKVKFKTDKGDLIIELYPEAAPRSAKQFEELVKAGFYDNTPIFRIVPGFVAQFGVNSDAKHKAWKEKTFLDEPPLFKLEKGTLAFARSQMPNSSSTQVFINYGDNSGLVAQNFVAFGKITKGYELTEKFKQVGDPSMGLDQGKLWEDTQGYLKSLPEKPNMILKAEVLK